MKISSNKYGIKTLRSVEELEEIRNIWSVMQWHPNTDRDFYLLIINIRPEIIRPHVLLITQDGHPISLVVGRIEEKRLNLKIGYLTVYRPKVRVLEILYGGFLGKVSKSIGEIVISELLNSLKVGEADLVTLGNLPVDSEIYQLIKSMPNSISRGHSQNINLHWKMAMPASYDDFLKRLKSKRRNRVRRMATLLEEDYPGKVEFKCYKNIEFVDHICSDCEKIASKTYHRSLGVGYVLNEENYNRISLSAKRGWLRAFLLYIDKKPSAFFIGTLYKEIIHLDFTGFDPKFKRYEPGKLLFFEMIRFLSDDNIKEIDFGSGDAIYKKQYCDKNWKEASVNIFSKNLNGLKVKIIIFIIDNFDKFARVVLKRLKLVEKIKRIWRNYLSEDEDATRP